jgi:hypothetical protein
MASLSVVAVRSSMGYLECDRPGASSTHLMAEREHDREIASIQCRLAELAEERKALEARLEQLRQPGAVSAPVSVPERGDVTAFSPAGAKVALFRSLFAGRTDVFPVRWENPKQGAPATRQPVPTSGSRGSAASRG